MRKGPSAFNITAVGLGLAFLYLPIVILVIYSFNASRLVTVWGGWSTRWYVALWHDAAMLDELGGTKTYNHYPNGWAMAFNTPFKMWKRYEFNGGTSDPCIISWPAGMKARMLLTWTSKPPLFVLLTVHSTICPTDSSSQFPFTLRVARGRLTRITPFSVSYFSTMTRNSSPTCGCFPCGN